MAQSDPDETGRCVDQLSGELAAFADLLYILVLAGEDQGEGVNDLRDPISSAWRYAQRIASTVRKLNEDWPSAQLAAVKAEG